jgi:hypothetical protein
MKQNDLVTTADILAIEAAQLLAPYCRRLKININIIGFPPYTLPDDPDRKHAYMVVSGETEDKDDWAVTQVKKLLDNDGFRTERHSDREIRILGRFKE